MDTHQPILDNPYAANTIRIKSKQLCRRADFSRSDEDDIQQELLLYLLKVAHLFNPKRATAETFIARALDTCIAMILRDRRRQKREGDLKTSSLEGTITRREGRDVSLESLLSETDGRRRIDQADPTTSQFEFDEAFGATMAHMPELLRQIAERLMKDTPTGVARELGISRRQVNNAIEQMRTYFDDAGFGLN